MSRVPDTVIVDSGGANLASLEAALQRCGARAEVSRDPRRIAAAERVVLPGVGAAPAAVARLRELGLARVLRTLTQPVLGICLGMQLLFDASEEGPARGLGLIPGTARKLRARTGLPVPHMGWNQLTVRGDDPLLQDIEDGDYAYFVHSYAVTVSDVTLASADYGTPLSAVVRLGNFWGTQFHPERSAGVGARLLRNFLGAACC
ncbi:MAG: imidazole glycerol phosphate synthase subunit HisH [Proteobacteria bacterium]|nr:imidazole glycerol phosphate synthase subunit HisH [Pseudomonadota bacterium]